MWIRRRRGWAIRALAAVSVCGGLRQAEAAPPPSSPDPEPPPTPPEPAPTAPATPPEGLERRSGDPAPGCEPRALEATDAPCAEWCGRYPSFDEMPRVAVGVDLLPEIGTSAGYEDNHVRHLSLNLVGGYAGGLEGVELSSVFGLTTSHVYGVQLAGLFALGGGNLYGVEVAGLVAAAASSVYGLQLAGGMNSAGGTPRGVQLAGGVNLANDGLRGLQLAAGANLAGGLAGAQVAGALNIVDSRDGAGAQLGAVNIATSGLAGLQLGAVNVSGPGKTRWQLGVVNVAETSDLSLGLVNVLWAGRTHLDVWFADTGFAHVGLAHGGRYFHHLYGVGVRGSGGPQASLALGLGAHLPLPGDFFVDVDGLGHAIVPAADEGGTVPLLGTLRVLAGIPLASSVALLVGPSYSILWTREADRGQSYPLLGDVEVASTGHAVVRGWPGFVLGLQFFADVDAAD